MRTNIFYLLVLLLFPLLTWGQLPNEALYREYRLNLADSNKLKFEFHNTNYFRNTEYFNQTEEGRTLFGNHLHPQLSYQEGSTVKVLGGLWLRQDFGGKQPFTQVIPTFTVKLQKELSKGTFSALFGSLEGGMSHQLLEPIYDINRAIISPIEYGLQAKYINKSHWFDGWLNWEKFIEPGDPFKEKLSGGVHYRYTKGNTSKITAYSQTLIFHEAGQIDTDTITPFQILINQAFGLRFEHGDKNHWLYYGELSGLLFNDVTFSGLFPYKNGQGVLAQLGAAFKGNHFALNYWSGSNYIAPRGTSIYQSVSTVDSVNYQSKRQLVFLRLINNFPVFNTSVQASFRFEPFIDLNTRRIDYSGSVYLVFAVDKVFKSNSK
jgi:hypothetical protein